MNLSHSLSSSPATFSPGHDIRTGRRKGKLVVVEGIDGSGKSVQTSLLMERLLKEGYQVQKTDFPQYGKSFFANVIVKYLKGEFGWPQELKNHLKKYPLTKTSDLITRSCSTKGAVTEGIESKPEEVNPYLSSLLYAGDRWEIKDKMNKWLDEGNIIISDRYVCSNMAHQGAKISSCRERNKFFKWIEELEYKVYAIPRADIVIYLHVPIGVSKKLIKARMQSAQGFKSEVDLHEEDINYLKKVQNIYINLTKEDSSWFAIDCSKDNQIIMSKKEIAEKVWNIVCKILN